MIPGVEPSNDKLLQGRLAYLDAKRNGIGLNFLELNVTRPNMNPKNKKVSKELPYKIRSEIKTYKSE